MHTYVRGYVADDVRAALAQSQPGSPIRFTASTAGVKRDGLTIEQSGWELDDFRANPAFLWAHDYTGGRPPIGRVEKVWLEDGDLKADVTFDQGDEFAREIERKYRQGYLNAVSVGWDILDMQPSKDPAVRGTVTKANLLDLSAVPIPGDPGALMERQKRALADFGRELLTAIEPETPKPDSTTTVAPPAATTPASATWEETATALVRLYTPFAQRPEDERKAEYQRLARAYARHGKTPPEYVAQAHIDAMGDAEFRGLFLDGEPDLLPDLFAAMATRAGAVLSTRNRDDLERAISLIQGVLSRAKKETTDDQTDDERAMVMLQSLADGLAGVAA